MTEDEFVKIMSDDIERNFGEGCNACKGLDIIRKYCPNRGIEYADHDVIGSVNVSEIVEAGITKKDVIKLRALNWMLCEKNECLEYFI